LISVALAVAIERKIPVNNPHQNQQENAMLATRPQQASATSATGTSPSSALQSTDNEPAQHRSASELNVDSNNVSAETFSAVCFSFKYHHKRRCVGKHLQAMMPVCPTSAQSVNNKSRGAALL
jgi:hypothetical protein